MLQINCDWHERWTALDFETALDDFKFNGTGIYCTKTDTVLIVPALDDNADATATPWKMRWPTEQLFDVYVWNMPVKHTLLCLTVGIPTRLTAD
jgi:hypothetical protein